MMYLVKKIFFTFVEFFSILKNFEKVNLYMAWFYRLASLYLADYIFSRFSLFLCEVYLSYLLVYISHL